MKKHILFDLDGTLTDPALGITNSIMYALKKMNMPVPPRSELIKYIGPPLIYSFVNYCKMTETDAKRAVVCYREYFADKGIFENSVYDGIESMLGELISSGRNLYIATSKPEHFARIIAKHFNIEKYFTFIGGSTLDEKRTDKSEVIEYVLSQNHIEREDAIMVGDRKHDIIGAKQCAIECVGVLYGYGSFEELSSCHADHICQSVSETKRFLLGC